MPEGDNRAKPNKSATNRLTIIVVLCTDVLLMATHAHSATFTPLGYGWLRAGRNGVGLQQICNDVQVVRCAEAVLQFAGIVHFTHR